MNAKNIKKNLTYPNIEVINLFILTGSFHLQSQKFVFDLILILLDSKTSPVLDLGSYRIKNKNARPSDINQAFHTGSGYGSFNSSKSVKLNRIIN